MFYKKLYLQDMGGVKTKDGRRIKKGVFFRSNDLNRISNEELSVLENIPINHIIDLRQKKYVYKYPDRYIPEVVTHISVDASEFKGITPAKVFLRRVNWKKYHIEEIYITMFEQNKEGLVKFFHALLDRPIPVLVHCTAGKDRSGVFSALFQLSLGVSLDDVILYYEKIREHLEKNLFLYIKILSKITPLPDVVLYIDSKNLKNLIFYLEEKYGGIRKFLKDAGFSRFSELQERFLEEIEP